MRVNELSSLALAYIGDAVYELAIRKYVISSGQVKLKKLHGRVVQFVTAPAQANIVKELMEQKTLTDQELGVVRRGRNAKGPSVPKNISIEAYRYATAFEALIGFHYLNNNTERLHEIIQKAIQIQLQLEKENE